ncbi:MAG: helix-turn-helix transcriptional regulator [Tannerellaceae bacterium]|nr:helix-turn-helix transcriptional regulator [Tannerellaceae bacterium]
MIMSEAVEAYPSLIPVINRFGIRLGLGDRSVEAICHRYNLDADFLLTVINTFLNEEYFPEKKLQSFHKSLIIDYLNKTNEYYLRNLLPNIERHLDSFIRHSPEGNPTLSLIADFFDSFKSKLLARIECDKSQGAAPVGEDSLEELLADLKRLIITHLAGNYDDNLCYAVIFGIHSLEKDIKQNNRIRYRILHPCDEAGI